MAEDEKTPEEEPVDAQVVEEDEVANTPPAPAGGALVVQGSTQIIEAAGPEEQIEIATRIATSLDRVIRTQGLRTRIGSHKVVKEDGSEVWEPKYHTNIEGWQTLGTFLGVVPIPKWTRRVLTPDGTPEIVRYPVKETTRKYEGKGNDRRMVQETIREYMREGYSWEARVELFRNGVMVGAGEAMCSRSEEKWAESDDQAMRSMAQTRATSKALKAPAGWIVALAGYSATPLEEMDGVPRGDDQAPDAGPPFGPKLNDRARSDVQAKLVALLADETAAEKAWAELKSEAGGYMPRIVAKAIVILQTNAIPFGADDDNPDPLKDDPEADGAAPTELPEAATAPAGEEAPDGD